jgi:hypothetical protein
MLHIVLCKCESTPSEVRQRLMMFLFLSINYCEGENKMRKIFGPKKENIFIVCTVNLMLMKSKMMRLIIL